VHARDIADAFALCLTAPADLVSCRAYNIGSETNNVTVEQIARRVAESVPGARVDITGETGADPRSYRVDFARARIELGFEAVVPVADGAAELADAYVRYGLTAGDFERSFTRLARLAHLQSAGHLDEKMRRVSEFV